MGYFDYLEEKTQEKREFQYFDVWAKAGTFVGLGSLLVTIASILVFALAVPVGENIWFDFLTGAGLVIGCVGVALSAKSVQMARNIRKTTPLGKFALIWGIFVILIDLAILVANTWLYFA